MCTPETKRYQGETALHVILRITGSSFYLVAEDFAAVTGGAVDIAYMNQVFNNLLAALNCHALVLVHGKLKRFNTAVVVCIDQHATNFITNDRIERVCVQQLVA